MQKQYKFKAVDINKKFSGIYLAEDENDLTRQLEKQGLYLVSCKVYNNTTPSAFFTLGTGKVTHTELTNFCRHFAIMINSGLTVLECLDALRNQSFSPYFKSILQIIYADVKGGFMLSSAIEKHKKAFPQFFRSMVKVGEYSCKLAQVFNNLATYYEKEHTVKAKTASALSYPIILLILTFGTVILMLVFIVPTFQDALKTLNVTPTGLTKVAYDVSDYFNANYPTIILVVIVVGLILFLFAKTKAGKSFFDWLKINAPFIGTVNVNIITAKFARCFGLLISSGMDLTEALDSVVIVFGNVDVEKRFKAATEHVKNGMSVSTAFEHYKLFPEVMLQMIAVAEKTATFEEVMEKSANFYDDMVDTSLNSFVNKLQPIILGILGVVVGGLFVAVYSPILSIMDTLTIAY